jgi:hypothetical protein
LLPYDLARICISIKKILLNTHNVLVSIKYTEILILDTNIKL